MRITLALAISLLIGFAVPARGDLVYLTNGRVVEGRVIEDGDQLIIEMAYGSISISKSRVVRVEKQRTVLDEYDARRAQLKPNDAQTRFDLGRWCEENGLPRRAKLAYQQAVRFDPEHAAARQALGYVRHDGRWMTHDEMMLATGHVRYEGRWITREQYLELRQRELERREAEVRATEVQSQAELREAELEILRAEREKLEAERFLLEAEREKLSAETETLGERRWWTRFGWPVGSFPFLTIIHPPHQDTKTNDTTNHTTPPPPKPQATPDSGTTPPKKAHPRRWKKDGDDTATAADEKEADAAHDEGEVDEGAADTAAPPE